MAHPQWWEIATGCTREAYACGQAQGIQFGFSDVLHYVTQFGQGMPLARPSMLLDHQARRVSEIDAINGMVPLLGRELNIPTPYNDTMAAVVRKREEAFL
jgi:2-dehydropantoate 2-reductase